jgi:hypothetical protein
MNLDEMRDRIAAADPLPSGTLRIYGDWFGRPYDNQHEVVWAEIRDEALVIGLDDGEELTVTGPVGLEVDGRTLRIGRADHIRLEWHLYGQPKTDDTRCWQEHWLEDGRVRAVAAVPHFMPSFAPSTDFPAVELLDLIPGR